MANRISQLRKSMNLSQVDLAKQMGVGQSTMSRGRNEDPPQQFSLFDSEQK